MRPRFETRCHCKMTSARLKITIHTGRIPVSLIRSKRKTKFAKLVHQKVAHSWDLRLDIKRFKRQSTYCSWHNKTTLDRVRRQRKDNSTGFFCSSRKNTEVKHTRTEHRLHPHAVATVRNPTLIDKAKNVNTSLYTIYRTYKYRKETNMCIAFI